MQSEVPCCLYSNYKVLGNLDPDGKSSRTVTYLLTSSPVL